LAIIAVNTVIMATGALSVIKRRKTIDGGLIEVNTETSSSLSGDTVRRSTVVLGRSSPTGSCDCIPAPRVKRSRIDIIITRIHIKRCSLSGSSISYKRIIILKRTITSNCVPAISIKLGHYI
jgi:hypothetical protein